MSKIYVKSIRNDFSKIAGVTIQDVADSLFAEAEGIMTASKLLYVPVVTGALKQSGTVLRPEIAGDKITVTLGYGSDEVSAISGKPVTYAEVVHEAPKSYGQGRNKYLTTPAYVAAKNMSSRIAKDLQRRVRSRKI